MAISGDTLRRPQRAFPEWLRLILCGHSPDQNKPMMLAGFLRHGAGRDHGLNVAGHGPQINGQL
jgi:hypothetical protein